MQLFKWNESLRLGVDAMDEEHQELVSLMNDLHLASENLQPKAEVEKLLDALLAFTKTHFADEEAFMLSIDYKDLEKHKRGHTDLLKRLEDENRKFKLNEARQLTEGFFSFLQFWLKTHIQSVDQKYAYFSNHRSQMKE